jgi:hypothetical protein
VISPSIRIGDKYVECQNTRTKPRHTVDASIEIRKWRRLSLAVKINFRKHDALWQWHPFLPGEICKSKWGHRQKQELGNSPAYQFVCKPIRPAIFHTEFVDGTYIPKPIPAITDAIPTKRVLAKDDLIWLPVLRACHVASPVF